MKRSEQTKISGINLVWVCSECQKNITDDFRDERDGERLYRYCGFCGSRILAITVYKISRRRVDGKELQMLAPKECLITWAEKGLDDIPEMKCKKYRRRAKVG